jgi:hypothetical protein
MNRLLIGSLATFAVFALTSFAFNRTASSSARALTGPAWTVSQYQLDRAFRQGFNFPGGPAGSQQTISMQMPPTGGLIITQILAQNVYVTVNGADETIYFEPSVGLYVPLDPPIVLRPGDTIVFHGLANAAGLVAGYTTLPGET